MKKLKSICIIPIRSGSKGIKNKNLIKLRNKPLFYYVINEALKIKKIDKVIIAIDSKKYHQEIKKYFKNKKIQFFYRSAFTSTDKASTELVISEVISKLKISSSNLILLQITSPLTKSKHILESLNYFIKNRFDSLFSSYKKIFFIWKKKNAKLESINYNHKKRPRRQEFYNQFVENGAIYIFKSDKYKKFKNRLFGKIGTYVMSEKFSHEIDSFEDLETLNVKLNSNK